MVRRNLSLFAVIVGLGGGAGCRASLTNAFDDLAEATALDAPFDATLAAQGVDASSVRAGIFAASSMATIRDAAGSQSEAEVSLDVDDRAGGRVTAFLPGGVDSTEIAALQSAERDGDALQFTLPDLNEDTDLVVVVWYDDDGDGKLDLGVAGNSETARTIARDNDGQTHYLVIYDYDAAEGVFHGTAVANGSSNLIITDDLTGGWTVTIDHATE